MLNKDRVEYKKANLDLPQVQTKEEVLINLQFEYDTWEKISIEDFNNMSVQTKADEYTKRLQKLKNVLNIVGNQKNKIPTYNQLWGIQRFVFRNFNYVSDIKQYKVDDFWDTEASSRFLITGVANLDCDDFGYLMVSLLHHVLNIHIKNIYRASCWTETRVGHFVVWTKATDGVMYQLENRFDTPKTLKWYKDLGYEYVYYSPMTITDKWFKAPPKVATEIYNTPNNLASDKAKFSFTKAFSVEKSKTLTTNWLQIVAGLTTAIVSLVGSLDSVSYTTIIISSSMLIVFGVVGVYLRTITDKDIDLK